VCGGVIIGNLAPTVQVDGYPVVVVGAAITPHGPSPHDTAHMIQGSSTVFANGIAVCRVGDLASCGHTVSTGSPDASAG
jgi:uncharacterized Zn-binding protein involved in type VI secretion